MCAVRRNRLKIVGLYYGPVPLYFLYKHTQFLKIVYMNTFLIEQLL